MILVAIKGFIYAIAVDIYVFRLAFSGILHCVLHHFDQKWVLVAVSLNKNSFCLYVQLSPFCTKINLRENRFFARR